MSTCTLERVREAVRQQLHRLGADPSFPMRETMLIRSGLYCGRRFGCGSYQAVWFIEEDEVKFYGPCGDVLITTSATACVEQANIEVGDGHSQPTPHRRAA
ncbi:MAG: hypothetical protein KatS3mg111_0204 [Pirellulaceae bacterium]|nr:MAG: hypothetical protein KatS3mg111_0204 [Pirellulaceae bacterium]